MGAEDRGATESQGSHRASLRVNLFLHLKVEVLVTKQTAKLQNCPCLVSITCCCNKSRLKEGFVLAHSWKLQSSRWEVMMQELEAAGPTASSQEAENSERWSSARFLFSLDRPALPHSGWTAMPPLTLFGDNSSTDTAKGVSWVAPSPSVHICHYSYKQYINT